MWTDHQGHWMMGYRAKVSSSNENRRESGSASSGNWNQGGYWEQHRGFGARTVMEQSVAGIGAAAGIV